MLSMEVRFGTMIPQKIVLDLDEYGKRKKEPYDNWHSRAYQLLRVTLNDTTFMDDGCRNDDAVNSLIALHVLGYNAEEWMENFLSDMRARRDLFHSCDINRFEDHVERVVPYLDSWGPENCRHHALLYKIDCF